MLFASSVFSSSNSNVYVHITMVTGSHCGGPGSIPGQSMWHLRWTRWHYDRFLSQYIPPNRHTHLHLHVTLIRRTSGRRQLHSSCTIHAAQRTVRAHYKASPLIMCSVRSVCNDRQHTVHCAGQWTAYSTNRSNKGEDRSGLSQLRVVYCVCPWGIGWQHVLSQKDHLQVMDVSKLLRRITELWVVCI